MIEVGPHGGFSVNGLGLARAPFPLSFSVRQVEGSWLVDATAAQANELADVLAHAAQGSVVIVDLATNSFLDEDDRFWPASRIAAGQGVDFQAHSLDMLASDVIGLSEETLVLRRQDLGRFLAGWSPYELTLVDVPGTPTPERLDEIALVLGTATHNEPVLPDLAGSRLWFSGHDDCYVAIESTDPAMPATVLGRLLTLLIGSALADAGPVEVREPDNAIVAGLIAESPHWIGKLGAVAGSTVSVDLSATTEPWRLSQPSPDQIDHTAVYDAKHRAWELTAPPRRE